MPENEKRKSWVEIGDRRGFSSLGARRLAAKMNFRFDLRERKRDGARVSVLRERVDPRAAGISEAEELGDFVVGFSGGVVDGAADEVVDPCAVGWTGQIEMGVATGDN